MKILIIILLVLSGCKQTNIESKQPEFKQTNIVTMIDSCEYVFAEWNNETVLLHKDSCVQCRENVRKTWQNFTRLQKINFINSLKKD